MKKTPLQLAEHIVARVRERGSDTDNVRDAAHEASHALEYGVRFWDRESIHATLRKQKPVKQGVSEVFARAVEAEICLLCEEPYNQDEFLLLAQIESIKGSGIQLPDNFKDLVEEARKTPQVQNLVKRICQLRPLKT